MAAARRARPAEPDRSPDDRPNRCPRRRHWPGAIVPDVGVGELDALVRTRTVLHKTSAGLAIDR
jgi:hypothetical protein